MSLLQVRSQAGAGWPKVPVPGASVTWAAYQELDRTQWLQPEEIRDRQLLQLRVLLEHCNNHVPYYRSLFQQTGFPVSEFTLDDFHKLPPLTRQIYQDHFDDLRAATLPSGMAPIADTITSGTSGIPIKIRATNRVHMWWHAFALRDLEWTNIDPRGSLASFRTFALPAEVMPKLMEGVKSPSWSPAFAEVVETGPCFAMDMRQDPRKQLAFLLRCRPDYIVSMPSNLEVLAGLHAERGTQLAGLKAIQAIGESLDDAVRYRIEESFKAPVKNLYSATEAGYIASACPSGSGYHVHSENVYAEVLDESDRPCPPGATGRLVFTTLHNFLAPFIRYEILDEVTLADSDCSCGRGLPLWKSVHGRVLPPLHLSGGRRKSSMGAAIAVRSVGGARQFQLIQKAVDQFTVRIVPDATWSAEHEELIRETVRTYVEASVRVDVEKEEFLSRAPGGKLKMVVVEVGTSAG